MNATRTYQNQRLKNACEKIWMFYVVAVVQAYSLLKAAVVKRFSANASGIRVVIVLVMVTTRTMVRFPLDAQGRRLASSLKTLPMLGSQQSLTIESLFELFRQHYFM